MIQYQILQIDIIRVVWQTVKRITNKILEVKGLKVMKHVDYSALSLSLILRIFASVQLTMYLFLTL